VILRVPDFPPLSSQGKPPRPLVLLLGQGPWQAKAAAELSPSCGCVVCTDVVDPGGIKALPALWLEVVLQYLDTADAVGVWAGESGLYLDEWTVAAFICGKRPQAAIAGSGPDPEHPMTPGFINLAMQAGVPVFARYEIFIAALRDRARQSRGG
jgi:hypothetical protein